MVDTSARGELAPSLMRNCAEAQLVVPRTAVGLLEDLLELLRGDRPAHPGDVAADAAPAVTAQVLEELVVQVDEAPRADRGEHAGGVVYGLVVHRVLVILTVARRYLLTAACLVEAADARAVRARLDFETASGDDDRGKQRSNRVYLH